MKKIIILMGIAALAFASCAKDTVKETNGGRAIDFRVAAQTRATETTTANLTTFYVTAIDNQAKNYFTDAAFTKIEEYFSSSPSYYWPGDGSALQFYAYAPDAATLGATATITGAAKTLANFSPAEQITDQKDFVTATATGSKANEVSGVALTFDHQLTQIEVKARNANEAYVYKIKGVRIAQPVSKADFDFDASEWTLQAEKAIYQVQYNDEITLGTYGQNIMKSEGDNAMLIPQQLVAWNPEDKTNDAKGAYLSVYAQVETTDGTRVYPKVDGMDYAWLAVPIDTKWEAGYKYVYTLDFTNGAGWPDPFDGPVDGPVLGGAIKFTMDVNLWGEKSAFENQYELMNGKWKGKKAIVTEDDGSVAELTTEEEVKTFLTQYYKLEIQDCCRILLNINGEQAESLFSIKDGYMYMDMVNNDGVYECIPHIDYVDEDEFILTIAYPYETQKIYFQKDN